MRLVEVRLQRFRRFEDARVNLDADVLALVGPNEAGKSSVLEALASLEHDEAYEVGQLTDREDLADDAVVVEARYLLSAEERDLTRAAGGLGKPRWFVRAKTRAGKLLLGTHPLINRDTANRSHLRIRLKRALANTHYRRVIDHVWSIPRGDKKPPDDRTLRELFEDLISALTSEGEMLPREIRANIGLAADLLAQSTDDVSERSRGSARALVDSLYSLADDEKERPSSRLHRWLDDRRPQLLLFGQSHRRLRSVYEQKHITSGEAALDNLLRIGGTTPDEVRELMMAGDPGRLRGLESSVNEKIKDSFTAAWQQSDVYPEFDFGDEVVRLHVPHPTTGYSLIAERSDGVKAFIALFAFTLVHAENVPPILLVDEAERHLHYDAQADLVSMFYRQRAASQLIYTTHSAGCLPHDLGMGIRVVPPLIDEDSETGHSELRNAFWESGAGFTPLLLAMGASALAFAPARRALMVAGEGAADLILLPSLLAEVAGEEPHFQVAPGIANISPEKVPELDLEAPRVVYLADGDKAGSDIARVLRKGGVTSERIVRLPKDCTIEDMVEPELLAAAVNEELDRSGVELRLESKDLPRVGRAKAIERWCKRRSIGIPSKVRIAQHVVEHRSERNIASVARKRALRSLLRKIYRALEIRHP